MVRPEEATAADALGEDGKPACRAVAAYGEPLIVDWKSTDRLDLELAMKEGVAVVAYTCDRFKLLKRCKIEGSYGACGFHGLRACNSGGELLLVGKGVPKDLAKARTLFEQGCPNEGSTGWDACESLAELYDAGTGVTQDRARAAELYVKAGMTFKAGQMYELGDGVPRNQAKALAAYDRGCRKFSRDDGQKSCDAQGRLLEQVDEGRARKHYVDLCERMLHQPSYAKAKRLGGK